MRIDEQDFDELLGEARDKLNNLRGLCHFDNNTAMLSMHAADLGNTTERLFAEGYIYGLRQAGIK